MSTADKLNALVQTKADIKQALIDKGQNPSDVFSTYADDIRAIETGGVIGFEMLGYTGNEEPLKSNLEYSKSIMDNWDASITNRSDLYQGDKQIKYFPLVDFSKVTNASGMFNQSSIELVPKLDTSNVTDMSYMFNGCNNLVEVPQFDYSKVTKIDFMFNQCNNLKSVGYIDCTNIKSIIRAINQTSLTYNPFYNTENVTNMSYAFANIKVTELDLSGFNTSSATDMSYMFDHTLVNKLDLSNFDTTKVTNMANMFYYSKSKDIEIILPENFGCACTNFAYMFQYSEILHAPEIDTSKASNLKLNILSDSKIIKFDGISLKGCQYIGTYDLSGYSNTPIRYIVIKDIGYGNYSEPTFNFNRLTNWGIEDETIPLSIGAKQSVVDSLITYSFDRYTAGQSTATITLGSNTKGILTEDEIAQITAKGYTIA